MPKNREPNQLKEKTLAIIKKMTIGTTMHFTKTLDFGGRFSIGMIFGLVNSVIVVPTHV